MSVKLIAITQPRIDTDGNSCENGDPQQMSPGDFIAYVARVSNPSNQTNTLTANKLLKYLIEHKHWSPFELLHITMSIDTTRDIGRQILRHGSFKFQEFSQRYADVSSLGDLFSDFREARLQDPKNRQNSVETDDEDLASDWDGLQDEVKLVASRAYQWALDNGIAKEQARVVLPEGLTNTRMYMSGSLRSWIHYCDLRMANGTQKEHADIAKACWEIVIEEIPSLSEILVGE